MRPISWCPMACRWFGSVVCAVTSMPRRVYGPELMTALEALSVGGAQFIFWVSLELLGLRRCELDSRH